MSPPTDSMVRPSTGHVAGPPPTASHASRSPPSNSVTRRVGVTVRLSRLTWPTSSASYAQATVLAPLRSSTVSVWVAHVDQLTVLSSQTCLTFSPLTYRLIDRGRGLGSAFCPFAYRSVRSCRPARSARTANVVREPGSQLRSTNPAPEYPAWFVFHPAPPERSAASAS